MPEVKIGLHKKPKKKRRAGLILLKQLCSLQKRKKCKPIPWIDWTRASKSHEKRKLRHKQAQNCITLIVSNEISASTIFFSLKLRLS